MKSSIFVRSRNAEVSQCDCPFPLVNYEVQESEDGTRSFIPSDPVKPCLASDYSPAVNSVVRGNSRGISRMPVDAVDVESKVKSLLND